MGMCESGVCWGLGRDVCGTCVSIYVSIYMVCEWVFVWVEVCMCGMFQGRGGLWESVHICYCS